MLGKPFLLAVPILRERHNRTFPSQLRTHRRLFRGDWGRNRDGTGGALSAGAERIDEQQSPAVESDGKASSCYRQSVYSRGERARPGDAAGLRRDIRADGDDRGGRRFQLPAASKKYDADSGG